MTTIMLVLHFAGLVMGFTATFAGMATMRLIGSATPQEAEVLRRIQTPMLRLSSWGVVLLLVTGPMLVYAKYDGAWGSLPLAFWLKMLAVVAVVIFLGLLHMNLARARKGSADAAPRIQMFGPLTGAAAAFAAIFAVLAFA